jgi:signal transduction histidine kinase
MHRHDDKIKISLDIDPSLTEVFVNSDKMRLRQIVGNGLTNAMKYSYGNIVVRMKTARAASVEALIGPKAANAHPEWLLISVTDRGPGLPQGFVPFREFEQGDNASTRSNSKVASSGLGLSVSRALARFLGGDLVVGNKVGFEGDVEIRTQSVSSAYSGVGSWATNEVVSPTWSQHKPEVLGARFTLALPLQTTPGRQTREPRAPAPPTLEKIPFFFLGPPLPDQCDHVMRQCNNDLDLKDAIHLPTPEDLVAKLA